MNVQHELLRTGSEVSIRVYGRQASTLDMKLTSMMSMGYQRLAEFMIGKMQGTTYILKVNKGIANTGRKVLVHGVETAQRVPTYLQLFAKSIQRLVYQG